MKYLSLQEVQIMHDDIINEIGGLSGANPNVCLCEVPPLCRWQ